MAASELVEVVDAHLELADVPSGIPQAFGATGTSYKQKKSCRCDNFTGPAALMLK